MASYGAGRIRLPRREERVDERERKRRQRNKNKFHNLSPDHLSALTAFPHYLSTNSLDAFRVINTSPFPLAARRGGRVVDSATVFAQKHTRCAM